MIEQIVIGLSTGQVPSTQVTDSRLTPFCLKMRSVTAIFWSGCPLSRLPCTIHPASNSYTVLLPSGPPSLLTTAPLPPDPLTMKQVGDITADTFSFKKNKASSQVKFDSKICYISAIDRRQPAFPIFLSEELRLPMSRSLRESPKQPGRKAVFMPKQPTNCRELQTILLSESRQLTTIVVSLRACLKQQSRLRPWKVRPVSGSQATRLVHMFLKANISQLNCRYARSRKGSWVRLLSLSTRAPMSQKQSVLFLNWAQKT